MQGIKRSFQAGLEEHSADSDIAMVNALDETEPDVVISASAASSDAFCAQKHVPPSNRQLQANNQMHGVRRQQWVYRTRKVSKDETKD